MFDVHDVTRVIIVYVTLMYVHAMYVSALFILLHAVPSAAPVGFVVQSVSANDLSVSWERPNEIDINGVLDRYDIDYYIDGEPETLFTEMVAGDTLSVTLSSLNSFTIYNVSVAAVTIGRGPMASILQRTSGTCALVERRLGRVKEEREECVQMYECIDCSKSCMFTHS